MREFTFREDAFLKNVSVVGMCNRMYFAAMYRVGKQPKSDYYTGRKKVKKKKR